MPTSSPTLLDYASSVPAQLGLPRDIAFSGTAIIPFEKAAILEDISYDDQLEFGLCKLPSDMRYSIRMLQWLGVRRIVCRSSHPLWNDAKSAWALMSFAGIIIIDDDTIRTKAVAQLLRGGWRAKFVDLRPELSE